MSDDSLRATLGVDALRADALEALAGFHATDSNTDGEQVQRLQRTAKRYRLREQGPGTTSYKDAPHLRPDALRTALVRDPRPREIERALSCLDNSDPAAARRLRDDPAGASLSDLALLVAETETARRKAGLEATPAPVEISETPFAEMLRAFDDIGIEIQVPRPPHGLLTSEQLLTRLAELRHEVQDAERRYDVEAVALRQMEAEQVAADLAQRASHGL